jgi:exodeoxyribonuclease-3
MKLATWNVNSLAVRLPQVLDWLSTHQPDALCLQETKLTDDKFPHAEFVAAGYAAQWFGQKTYNGVALLTRLPATDVVKNIPGHADEQARVITATVGGIRVIGAYVPNGQAVDSDKYRYKLDWCAAATEFLRDELARHPALAVVGDFNIAPSEFDVWNHRYMSKIVSHTPVEVETLNRLQAAGAFTDVVREAFPEPQKLASWWSYRAQDFRKSARGLRLDHIWTSPGLTPAVVPGSATIHEPVRAWEQPSDHCPITVDLDV